MKYLFKFISNVFIYIAICVYWIFVSFITLFFCLGYAIWHFKIPNYKLIHEWFNMGAEEFDTKPMKKNVFRAIIGICVICLLILILLFVFFFKVTIIIFLGIILTLGAMAAILT